jgi:indolepyruvate decarboxylase
MNGQSVTSIGRYLLDSIADHGVRHVFGVPGDYNLRFLDEIAAHPRLEWVGNTTELTAAYMADGYARVSGLGVLVTTYGVGELSAANGIAGAFAEHVPVLHIVGTPTTVAQRSGLLLHHSLLDGDHNHFVRSSEAMACESVVLSPNSAAGDIDRTLQCMLIEQRPGYMSLPADLVLAPCHNTDKTNNVVTSGRSSSRQALAELADRARPILADRTRVCLLVDHLARRHDLGQDLDRLIAATKISAAVTLSGKGTIDESAASFAGLYIGAISDEPTRVAVEEADALISIGLVPADLSTGGFTANHEPSRHIELHPDHCVVAGTCINEVTMGDGLAVIARLLTATGTPTRRSPDRQPACAPTDAGSKTPVDQAASIKQHDLWVAIGRLLEAGDILAADQGTALYGMIGLRLPRGVEVISQPLWASLGYTLPAAGGAALASRAFRRRTIMVLGDGGAQMSAHELATLARNGLDPVIFVLNNEGYTVERAINGPDAAYNAIPQWNWVDVPAALGVTQVRTYRATTVGELTDAITDASRHPGYLRLIEVVLDRHDLPDVLSRVAAAIAARNSGPPDDLAGRAAENTAL